MVSMSNTRSFKVKIRNVPIYSKDNRYIVARVCDKELWFFGAFKNEDDAATAAELVDGIVIEDGE